MNKIIAILIAFMMLFAIGGSASAATLNIVTKDKTTWNQAGTGLVVLTYNEAGTDFVYEIDGIVTLPNTEYTLMYYVDKEPTGTPESFVNPGVVGIVITTVMSGADGSVLKSGVTDIASIPFAIDPNGEVGANGGYPGAKIWLVPSADVVSGINWADMGNFLYEENLNGAMNNGVPSHLITYTQTSNNGESTADLGICVEPSVGVEVQETVSFGKLYAGESSITDLSVDVVEYVSDPDCGVKDVDVEITVTPGEWSEQADIQTVVTDSPRNSVVNDPVNELFTLTAFVGAVVPGTYTEVITVSVVY